MSANIIEINSAQYEEMILKGEKAVVDFYSTECPPCEALASKYENLSELYGNDIKFFKIFRQENRELASKLGVTSSPTVLFFNHGKEAGKRISGGIKRSDLINNLDQLLSPKRAEEIKTLIKPISNECDILILGGGPTGLTSGIYSAQAKMKTILVDIAMPGGQVTTTHIVSNYPGFQKPVEGYMLMHFMSEQAKEAGVEFRSAVDVSNVDLIKKEILIDNYETIRAKKIIIATGASYRELNIPGEKKYKGSGISYCATCDAKYYEGKDVVVIGGGNSAVEESLFITKFAKKVTIVHQYDKLQANKISQEKAFANDKIEFIYEHEPREFVKNNDNTMEVIIEDLKTHKLKNLHCDGVFVFAGMKPNLDIFTDKIELDKWGYIKIDSDMKTNIEGVFAAGDVAAKRYRQITIAVSDGTVAALSAIRELDEGC